MHAASSSNALSASAAVYRPRVLKHLMRGVWIQALRRNELYVVAILMGVYVLGALVLRIVGIETPHVARFVAGLGFQLASVLASILVIVMGARMLPDELEQRTIYPILAKPVARWQILAGKGIPVFVLGAAALLIFSFATLLIAPHLPYQRTAMLFEALLVKTASLAMLTTLVLWLSLRTPIGVAMLLSAALQFGGAWLANAIAGQGRALALLAGLIPDLTLLDPFQRYVAGGAPLAPAMFVGLLAYAALWSSVFAYLAAVRFSRMRL